MAIDLTDTPDDDDSYPPAYRELVEPSQPTPKAIRQWAKATGLYVGTRGRIPADVELAYLQARLGNDVQVAWSSAQTRQS